MKKSKKIIQCCFAVGILAVMVTLCILNINRFHDILMEHLSDMRQNTEAEYKETFASIEQDFQENVRGKRNMVNVYGLYQKAIDHMIIDNFEYVADDYGIIHMINDKEDESIDHFVGEMEELQQCADKRQIPLVYVQAPNREIVNKGSVIEKFNTDDNVTSQIVSRLDKKGISTLDLRTQLQNAEESGIRLEDLYLHTDLHMQTDAEIWMGNQLAQYLQDNLSITIANKEYLSDMSLYDKKTYPMLGNYGRGVGEYFVGLDEFDIYYPKFDTDLEFCIPGKEERSKQGKFEQAVMNRYEQMPYDDYTYWVTNFGAFTEPYYKYTNHKQEETKLLIISDSIPYRAFSYLLLTVHEIDILDSRYFNGTDYLSMVLEEDYDAIIVWQERYLIDTDIVK